MAPTRTVKSKSFSKDGKSSKGSGKPGILGAHAKSKVSKKPKAPPPKQQKTKSAAPAKKKRRLYTEKELGIQKLNMITPVGVELPKGKKRKVFVDDQVGLQSFWSCRRILVPDSLGSLGEYDDYTGDSERGQRGPDREQNDEVTPNGGNS